MLRKAIHSRKKPSYNGPKVAPRKESAIRAPSPTERARRCKTRCTRAGEGQGRPARPRLMPTADRRTSSNLSSGTALPKRPFCIALGRTNAKRLQNIKVRPPLTGTDFGGDRPNLAHYMHPGALVHGVARPCAPPPPARQRK